MIDFHAQNTANPDFKEALDAVIAATWKTPATQNAYHLAIQRSVQSLTAQRLMDLAGDENASPLVRAEATGALRSLSAMLKATTSADAHRRATQELSGSSPDSCRRRPAIRSAVISSEQTEQFGNEAHDQNPLCFDYPVPVLFIERTGQEIEEPLCRDC
jgi:hypothetical protein